MPQPKPVQYPNLVDQIKAVVAAHDVIHDETMTHAKAHHAKLEDKHRQLEAAHMAKHLIEKDTKS